MSLKNEGDSSILFQMDDFDLITNNDSLIVKNFSGKIGNAPVNGKMLYLEKEEKIFGSLDIAEFAISKELFSKTPLKREI